MVKIGYLAANTPKAQSTLQEMIKQYQLLDVECAPEEDIDVLLVLGGDGFMLHALHRYMHSDVAIYGINCGRVGFLLNDYQPDCDLIQLIKNSTTLNLKILKVQATDFHGSIYNTYAINESSVFRMSNQATFLKVTINEQVCLEKLVGDGIIVATAAGSSAYNFSAGGSILPINASLLSIAGINTFRPRRWQSAIVPDDAVINLEVLEPLTRPIMVTSDYNEFHQVNRVEVSVDRKKSIKLLFNSQQQLFAKFLKEQFLCN